MKICIVDVVVEMESFVYFIILRHSMGARGEAVG
jgi:hypothetical protein